MFDLTLDVTLEQVTHNFHMQQHSHRKANFAYIAAGALVALKVNNLLDAKDKLAKLFDTKVSKEADFRLAALRMVKHHRSELLHVTNQASDITQANALLADYISASYASETGALYGKVNNKNVCLPRLSLFDAKRDKEERAKDAEAKQEAEQVQALEVEANAPEPEPAPTVCNAKKVEHTIGTICKMLADDAQETNILQESFAYALGVITGVIPVNDVEVDALLNVARKDFAAILERSVKRELKAA